MLAAGARSTWSIDRRANWLLVSPRPGGACENAPCQWHVRGAPHASLLKWPGVDRVAVANQLEQAWLVQLLGRPLVHALQARQNHRVVEQPSKAVLAGDIALSVARK